MQITLLKGKLHMASVTQAELWYDGSCAIDADLVKLAACVNLNRLTSTTSITVSDSLPT